MRINCFRFLGSLFLLAVWWTPSTTVAEGTGKSNHLPPLLLLPRDMAYDSVARMALQSLRSSSSVPELYAQQLLLSWQPDGTTLYRGRWNHTDLVTLTLMGNKGGPVLEQFNQDRSFITVFPRDPKIKGDDSEESILLLGVLDGHGATGHFVAEHARYDLLKRLRTRLSRSDLHLDDDSSITKILEQAFVETDAALPQQLAEEGGCTCSIVLQTPNTSKVYFANVGDSQSFLVAAVVTDDPSTPPEKAMTVQIMYATRLDKPTHPEERKRLKRAGAKVTPETEEDDARVWATDPQTGQTSGLAMSRGLGDRLHTAVIADPLVDVLDLSEMENRVRRDYEQNRVQQQQQDKCSAPTDTDSLSATPLTCSNSQSVQGISAVHFFAVSATDGVMDSLDPAGIAQRLAGFQYGSQGHPLLGLEDVLKESASLWHQHGQYRDDMAIAVAKLSSTIKES